jgi:hypothetical protein
MKEMGLDGKIEISIKVCSYNALPRVLLPS